MKIAINGFGRIGRNVFKLALEKGIEVAAVNELSDIKNIAYLLKHDSVYGQYDKKVSVKGNDLIIDGKTIKFLSEKDPSKLPWAKLDVDIAIESTGAFVSRNGSSKHLEAGAKHVIVTAPIKEGKPDLTIVPGVNSEELKKEQKIISVASCTTNCLAPMVKIINENFEIEKAMFTTVHAYTSSQALVDKPDKKPAKGRTAALNIIPATTGASRAVFEVLPELTGKIEGMAMRVPVACGSITDLTAKVKKKTSVKEVNNAFKKAAEGKMKGILEYNEEPLVSSDIIGNPHSSIFIPAETKVNDDLIKVLAWYDNEYGYSCRVIDVIEMLK